ncbi:hypothetical protein JZ751_009899 [Albula glossodonta]|uniref:Uncharacterized protein n=1 Tax=Albula glossodonta TaxID=121402 RepID=A0A8T2P6X2_9TELE|nr:hypothetical protein JZ751_009899 [Albula glossodonta]
MCVEQANTVVHLPAVLCTVELEENGCKKTDIKKYAKVEKTAILLLHIDDIVLGHKKGEEHLQSGKDSAEAFGSSGSKSPEWGRKENQQMPAEKDSMGGGSGVDRSSMAKMLPPASNMKMKYKLAPSMARVGRKEKPKPTPRTLLPIATDSQ